jgi:hypothetical protein
VLGGCYSGDDQWRPATGQYGHWRPPWLLLGRSRELMIATSTARVF